jgi:hypothetical protein
MAGFIEIQIRLEVPMGTSSRSFVVSGILETRKFPLVISVLDTASALNDLNRVHRLNVRYGPQYLVDASLPCLPSFFRLAKLESSAIVKDTMLPQAESIEGSIFIKIPRVDPAVPMRRNLGYIAHDPIWAL